MARKDRPANPDGLGRNQLERFGYEVRAAGEGSFIGRRLRDAASPEATLATIAVGAIGFHSGLTITDASSVSCRTSLRGDTAPAASTRPTRAKRRVPRRRAGG